MFRKLSVLALTAVLLTPSAAHAKFLGLVWNEKDVQNVIKQYLTDHPEVITQAMEAARVKQEQQRLDSIRAKLNSHRTELERDPTSPVLGNPDGDVVVVEFYDYNCGFCKMMFPKVWEKVRSDGNIRWVLKDLPTLSQVSATAAKAGLAAEKQGKFFEMHQRMITHEGPLSETDIMDFAQEVGLNMDQFKADMESESVRQILDANRALANQFEIQGIPQFIIGDYISNGAMMGNELEENVNKIRSQKK